MKSKKGIMLGEAFGAVLTLVLIALLVIISIYMFSALSTSFPLTSTSVVNESGWINSTGYTNLTYLRICNIQTVSSITAVNASSGLTINAANYTLNWNSGTITNASTVAWNNVYFSFNYLWGGQGCNAANTSIAQFGTFPALIGLVGTIIFLALVIGVLVTSFVFNQKKGA